MGACRESFDLFSEYGRRNMVSHLRCGRWRYPVSLVWRDTFGWVACRLVGHRPYVPSDPGEPEEVACRQCCKWLKTSPTQKGGAS